MSKKKVNFLKLPSTKILFRYSIIAAATIIVVAFIMPTILNYPPGSINTAFDVKMTGISYNQQFLAIYIASVILLSFLTKRLFKPIDQWVKDNNPKKYENKTRIKNVRKFCFNLPYIIFFIEIIVPLLCVTFVLLVTNSHHMVMVGKISIILFSFLLFFAVLSYIFSKGLYNDVLADTYRSDRDIGLRISLTKKVFLQILPLCIFGILLTSIIGYNQTVKSKEDALFKVYKNDLKESFDISKYYTIDEVKERLQKMKLYNDSDSKFILNDNKNLLYSWGTKPSSFMMEYTTQLSRKNNGRTYDSYAVDTQGATIRLLTTDGYIYVGIIFVTNSPDTVVIFGIAFFMITLLIILVLFSYGSSLKSDINTVTSGLNNIAKSNSEDEKLPVISNDEIGDLCISYNKVQELNGRNIQKIKDSQDLLIERERLASLGQMIGGIAHNLKTPIMSVSGAAEGIHDLTDELNRSIGNPVVTEEDFHAIASDIDEWTKKIKNHTSYMSDVITAVKGQAVTFSTTQSFPFTIDELFKQVDILMRHELKNSLINLRVENNVPKTTSINGNINSLVQIINNMISNSIQSYEGKPNSDIDLIANLRDNTVVIDVRDYGPGLPEEVKNKLFKEMVTTKGKNGTGLGLFMSYSNIKAHFQGDIKCKTEKNVGTTFSIIIPIK